MCPRNILLYLDLEIMDLANSLANKADDSALDEIDRMNSLVVRSMRHINKGDEGLIELYAWLLDNKEIAYDDALLLLFDYLNIGQ